ncbi:probable LRR receptor-like serine/threonine-protein kinase At1g74360 [Cucurbita moschata]|uniref:non-specific serine/threonine protein kinase n=1 Tax=Cucurbita moschata TaxID=3662 RepID=A0A6J1E1F0_CUCMO|nr:probable LRR receptor-like serine/threonine-protein kinase At1g74360 [Cucurbita moschata]
MKEKDTDHHSWRLPIIIFFILITGTIVEGQELQRDREVLLQLKFFLEKHNPIKRGKYSFWNLQNSPCSWSGISCNQINSQVTGIDLSNEDISGTIFHNFSAFPALTDLDLSRNTLSGLIPGDLNNCRNLRRLNLSHNIIDDKLNLSGLVNIETLDLSVNRIWGDIRLNFPGICRNLMFFNVSGNNFTGRTDDCFDECRNLQHVDLSSNRFNGGLWGGLTRTRFFSASENELSGELSPAIFTGVCNLEVLDLSENKFSGGVPVEVSNCGNLSSLNLWGNQFSGTIPVEIGRISGLQNLYLGKNNFSREIPESLLSLNNLVFLDLSKNNFGGDIQEIFGRFTQVRFLVLHGNSYTGGIYSSGILKLPRVARLDLSFNNFSGSLPVEISEMKSLEFLILAYNKFNGMIPSEYGNLQNLQALDLSFNNLNGSIPSSFGNLTSLLWLMLANNSLTGEIPRELGNCSSLLWLNLANNKLHGRIPSELSNIGKNATATFEMNRRTEKFIAGSGECLAMKRWIPADYPPFRFVYTILTRKSCRSIWDRLLKGYGLFPFCSRIRTLQISGYVQLTGNQFSGEIPNEIGTMKNFSMLHLSCNNFSGKLPPQLGNLPLVVLNVSENHFSGEIPTEIGGLKCLQNLDLSYNNFSGMFPRSFLNLNELNKFNISYNPLITGEVIPSGQFSTFDKDSYLGNPLLRLPSFFNITPPKSPANPRMAGSSKRNSTLIGMLASLSLILAFLIFGAFSLIVFLMVRNSDESRGYLLDDIKYMKDFGSSSPSSSLWFSDSVTVIRLDKTVFTYADILKATGNFSEDRVIGKGGYGTVYRGMLPDGRQVAVKKLQREGNEGEREFQAEMKILTGNGFNWPHPNLVQLYGWCLDGSEKILVYEYMEGGSLEDLIVDRLRLNWQRRIDLAIDVARALVFLHHECFPSIVHRDVKASNVLLDKDGRGRVTDFGLARIMDVGDSHVSTMVAGTIGYVAPEYGQTWKATTKGDVYSFGVLAMELATARRALDGGEECLVEWAKRVMGNGRHGLSRAVIPVAVLGSGLVDGADEMCELLKIGVRCTNEAPGARPNMKEVLAMLINIIGLRGGDEFSQMFSTTPCIDQDFD